MECLLHDTVEQAFEDAIQAIEILAATSDTESRKETMKLVSSSIEAQRDWYVNGRRQGFLRGTCEKTNADV